VFQGEAGLLSMDAETCTFRGLRLQRTGLCDTEGCYTIQPGSCVYTVIQRAAAHTSSSSMRYFNVVTRPRSTSCFTLRKFSARATRSQMRWFMFYWLRALLSLPLLFFVHVCTD
jgi:hypothetical protein